MQFAKATKEQAKLRLALAGPAGSGKTYTALLFASHIANGGRVAVLDTENGSASKYADLFEFDVAVLTAATGFSPEKYLEILHGAEQAGYAVIVIDSLSHEWNGTPGGILEAVDKAAAQNGGNKFAAWARVTPRHDALVRAIVESPIHVICTMRSKMDHVQEKNEKGRTEIRVVGMKPIQRDELEYEFDVYGLLDQDNRMVVKKSRCPALAGEVIDRPGTHTAEIIAAWLGSGVSPAPKPTAAPAPSGDEVRRDLAIAEYRELAARAIALGHPSADKIGATDPESLATDVLVASLRKLAIYIDQYGGDDSEESVPVAPERQPQQQEMPGAPAPFGFHGNPIDPAASTAIARHRCQAARPAQDWYCQITLERDMAIDFGGMTFSAGALMDRSARDYGRILCAPHFAEYQTWQKANTPAE